MLEMPGKEQASLLRAEEGNKHAQVLAARQALILKKWREFGRSSKQKKLRTLSVFAIFPASSNIQVNVSFGNLVYCF